MVFFLLACFGTHEPGAVAAETAAAAPIVSGSEPEAALLREWWAEGTAAGNVGDSYDNRDRGHSPLAPGLFPQLRRWEYTPQQIARHEDWGACLVVRPSVIVGNSSTARAMPGGGSNLRLLYYHQRWPEFLDGQYRSNNLFIYPEHEDHDPGRVGVLGPDKGGYGDVFPANSPYALVSQGSSVSDRPFMHAAFSTLAAFRPDTKRVLVGRGLLMPTLQMLFRSCSSNVTSEADYLSGRAHPAAFDGAALNPEKMCRLAHEMRPDSVPPLARLRVVSEDHPRPGVDIFDTAKVERLGDAPGAIVRIWRGSARNRRMVVSGESSLDAAERPLRYHWAILRGDAEHVSIRPLNEAKSVVEIVFAWAGRTPTAEGSPIESSRLEVGLFVSNGIWWSAPAFVTWSGSDREVRSYTPDGAIEDIGYTAGWPVVWVKQASPFLDWLRADSPTRAARYVRNWMGEATLQEFAAEEGSFRRFEDAEFAAWAKHMEATRVAEESAAALKAAEDAAKKQGGDAANAPAIVARREDHQRKVSASKDAYQVYANAEVAARTASVGVRRRISALIGTWILDPGFAAAHAKELSSLRNAVPQPVANLVAEARKRLLAFGLKAEGGDWRFSSACDRPDFTAFERRLLAEFNVSLFRHLIAPAGPNASSLTVEFRTEYQDPILFAERPWRDVYRYDRVGRLFGWKRYDLDGVEDFTADGLIVLKADRQGRAREAADVVYSVQTTNAVPATRVLKARRGAQTYSYSYDGPDDFRGKPTRIP